jgi:hypothetical protein
MDDIFDTSLHDTVHDLVFEGGPTELDWLERQARRRLRDARIDRSAVQSIVDTDCVVVGLPDGRVDHLTRVLDGMVLTQRVRAPIAGRRELWTTFAMAPMVALLTRGPLALRSGATIAMAAHVHEAILGPAGWLPECRRGAWSACGSPAGPSTRSQSTRTRCRASRTSSGPRS